MNKKRSVFIAFILLVLSCFTCGCSVVIVSEVRNVKIDYSSVKTTYKYGEDLSLDGLIVYEIYSNGNEVETDNYTIESTYNATESGSYEITICLSGTTLKKSFFVQVEQATICGVKIYTDNVQREFNYGEDFTCDGLIVTEIYEDGTEKETTEYTILHNYDAGNPDCYQITVTLNGTEYFATYDVIVRSFDASKGIKILAIGNSYSEDATKWLWQILDGMGVKNATVAHLFIGGSSLQDHANNARANNAVYQYLVNNNGEFVVQNGVSLLSGITAEDWDFVTLQQLSATSGITSSYDQDISYMVNYVKENATNPFVRLAWHMNWSWPSFASQEVFEDYYDADQLNMYNKITNAVQTQIIPSDLFDVIIPSGTAIQNARSSFLGDTLNRDNYHLSLNVGRYVAGLSYAAALTNLSFDNLSYVPSSAEIDDNVLAIIKESVYNAMVYPFEVTQSKYKDISEVLNNHKEINWQPVVSGYWESTTSANFITGTSVSVSLIASSIKFTKETLPVGSIITIKPGFKYRPEGWIAEEVQTSRPDYVTTFYLRIDESWWQNYSTRAFNVMNIDFTSLVNDFDSAVEALHVYVPNEAPSLETYIFDDSAVLSASGYDISNYVYYDWTPVCGWLNSIQKGNKITSGDGTSKKYIVSKWMDKKTLPAGTLMVLDGGYSIRPEGYYSGMPSSARPSPIANNTESPLIIQVTDDWWNNYTHRAIQLYYNTAAVFKKDVYFEKLHLRVYLPK